jgi:hypothetical protein
MYTIKMPGFTAETSLGRLKQFHLVSSSSGDMPGSQAILPQLRSIGFCQADCLPGDYLCLFRCMDQGSGGGGPTPPTQHCHPSCGPCHADPDSPTGRSRLCIKANCDDYDRNC